MGRNTPRRQCHCTKPIASSSLLFSSTAFYVGYYTLYVNAVNKRKLWPYVVVVPVISALHRLWCPGTSHLRTSHPLDFLTSLFRIKVWIAYPPIIHSHNMASPFTSPQFPPSAYLNDNKHSGYTVPSPANINIQGLGSASVVSKCAQLREPFSLTWQPIVTADSPLSLSTTTELLKPLRPIP